MLAAKARTRLSSDAARIQLEGVLDKSREWAAQDRP